MNITDAIDLVVNELDSLTFENQPMRVVTRLDDIQPPCVFVALDQVDYHLSGGEVTVRVFMITGDADEYRALKRLAPIHEAILTRLSPSEPTTAIGITTPRQQKPLPALQFTTLITL